MAQRVVIHGDVMLRPMLCRGPIDNEREYTLLLGAVETGGKLPEGSKQKAESHREVILDDHTRRVRHIRAYLEEPPREFREEEYRYAYAEDFLNTWIATQIVTLREQRGLSQSKLGELIGTKQPGVSRLENVNHSTWKSDTLKRIARALGVRLKITFETFGTLLDEDRNFNREFLKRASFADDPVFSGATDEEKRATRGLEFAMSSLLVNTEAINVKSNQQGGGIAAYASPVGNEIHHGATLTMDPMEGRLQDLAAVMAGYRSQQSHMRMGAS